MSDHDAVLFANEAFYRAFADCDTDAMAALWAEDAPTLCLHPGWPPLDEVTQIRESWRRIFEGQPPDVQCVAPHVQMHGDVALVVCYEQIGQDYLAAVNGFVRRGPIWRMVLHQAGPTAGRPTGPLRPENPIVN